MFSHGLRPLEMVFSRNVEKMKHWVRKVPGAGEMAQQLRALTTLPEVLSLIPSNHMVAHNQL